MAVSPSSRVGKRAKRADDFGALATLVSSNKPHNKITMLVMFQFILSQNIEHIESWCSRWWLERTSESYLIMV